MSRRTDPPFEVRCGDAREELLCVDADPSRTVIITDPVWPNAPVGMFDVPDPCALFSDVAPLFPDVARRVIVQLGCDSDPRFLTVIPRSLPFVRTCWMRYLIPSHKGPILNGADVAYVFGSHEGWEREEPRRTPQTREILPGEAPEPRSQHHRDGIDWHPTPRRLEHLLWLVRMFTRREDLVIDPFCGSGTTLVAALRHGRRALGIEIHEPYARGARARCADELRGVDAIATQRGQQGLFP
jgi:hypothetical protein